jgi:tRNA(fMet)-specific endonuclease VapC
MNGKYLFDTNIVISFLRKDDKIVKILREIDEIYVPVTVIGELYFGAFKSKKVKENLKAISSFMEKIPILENNKGTARLYGETKSQLKKKGKPLPENDIWIAAVAKQYGLTIITNDIHFKEIDNLQLYFPLDDEIMQ